jgi:large subunit ribosomal protein L30e
MYEDEIKKLLGSKKMILGKEEVLKNIRNGTMMKVYVASNCPHDVLRDMKRYSGISNFDILETNMPNDELGTLCKKPFSIAVLGVTK